MNAREFGELVRRRRKASGMTQRELALLIGSGERFIVNLEKGKATSQLSLALRAAAAVGIRLADASASATAEAVPPVAGYDLPWLRDRP